GDNDGKDEIFVFTLNKDSIFVHGVCPFRKGETAFYKKFIDITHKRNEQYTCNVAIFDYPDSDRDTYHELIIGIQTGLSKQPRNLYKIDISHDTVIKSPESGVALYDSFAFDIDNDGIKEYTGGTKAHGNFATDSSISFSDQHAWLMVFNKELKFVFEPVEIGEYKTIIDVIPFRHDKQIFLAVFQAHQGTEDIRNRLMLFDLSGKLRKERILTDEEALTSAESFFVARNNLTCDQIYFFKGGGEYEQLDINLEGIHKDRIKRINDDRAVPLDIDLDGENEFIFESDDQQQIIITRNDFTLPVRINAVKDIGAHTIFSLIKENDKEPLLFANTGNCNYTIHYSSNPLFPLKYPAWFGIYAALFVFLFLLQKVQHARAEKKYLAERKIAELQMRAIKGQTDPHFTLNLIDSIGNLFYKQDSEKASYVFSKYARLLRTTILSSEKIAVKLEQELEYVKDYLDLEKFRYDNKFDYHIDDLPATIKSVEIPKMLIHTFAENAVKHGIKHLEKKGYIHVSCQNKENEFYITIRDNGVGRKKADEFSKLSTGKGFLIVNQMLDLFFELKKVRITYDIEDLFDNFSLPEGTRISIKIPVK
ncbi:MAG: hypothetical protein FJY07_09765, partial [Bacteroidetes bacterium]|nr:hypothetical protein [Bacteroidota bacterium]